jgi:hypothetical protein
MLLGMGMRLETEPRIAVVAANLMTAWESGDRLLLEIAVREAASELGDGSHASAFANELRELLLCVVQQMNRLLAPAQTSEFRRGRQWEVCYGLLQHAQGAAAGAGRSSLQMQAGALN